MPSWSDQIRMLRVRPRSNQIPQPAARIMTMLGMALCVVLSPIDVSGEEPSGPASADAAEALQLLQSPDSYERKVGFLRLEALREPVTAEAVRQYVLSSDPDMRADSLRALAAIEGENAVPLLLEALKTRKWPRVRWSALLALEPFSGTHPELLPVFIEAMRDYRTEVRLTAVDIVSRIEDPLAREAIRTRARKELRPEVRRLLNIAVQRIESR